MAVRNRLHRRALALVAIFASLALVAGLTTPATAGPPSTPTRPDTTKWTTESADMIALMGWQDEMMAVLDEITAANGREPVDRLSGASTDPFKPFMTLFWKGEVPASVQAVIDRHADTVPVRVVPRTYNFVELEHEARRLFMSMLAEGVPVQMTAPDIETDGVIVRIIGNAENAKASTVLSTANVPVKVEYGHVPIQGSSRQDDSSPYYGDSRANACTTGWAVCRAVAPQ